jgi:hypothetical protein
MTTDLQKRALATRDAHLALLELKKLVDEAAQTTHAAELEAVQGDDIRARLRVVVDRLKSPIFESTLMEVREKLEIALST